MRGDSLALALVVDFDADDAPIRVLNKPDRAGFQHEGDAGVEATLYKSRHECCSLCARIVEPAPKKFRPYLERREERAMIEVEIDVFLIGEDMRQGGAPDVFRIFAEQPAAERHGGEHAAVFLAALRFHVRVRLVDDAEIDRRVFADELQHFRCFRDEGPMARIFLRGLFRLLNRAQIGEGFFLAVGDACGGGDVVGGNPDAGAGHGGCAAKLGALLHRKNLQSASGRFQRC